MNRSGWVQTIGAIGWSRTAVAVVPRVILGVALVITVAYLAPYTMLLIDPLAGMVRLPAHVVLRGNILIVLAAGLLGAFFGRRPADPPLFAMAFALAAYVDPIVGPSALLFICMAALSVTGRVRFSLAIAVLVLLGVVEGIELKKFYADSILTVQDVRYFFQQWSDNVGVLRSQPTLVVKVVCGLLAAWTLAWLIWRNEPSSRHEPASRWMHVFRGRFLIAAALLLAVLSGLNLNRIARDAAMATTFAPIIDRHSYSTQLAYAGAAFAVSRTEAFHPLWSFLSTLYVQATPDYQSADTSAFSYNASKLVADSQRNSVRPDIVLVLQESQFNPMDIADCAPSLCSAPAFDADQFTSDYGPLRVHVRGGGTWLSEFAVLNGIPHTVFGPAGAYAPFNVAPHVRKSFVRSLKALGYRTVAVYPVGSGMMNARSAYQAYGFDDFLDAQALHLSGGYSTRDALIHAAVVHILHAPERSSQPLFVMAVTIFNHGEHGIEMGRVPDNLIRSAVTFLGPGTAANDLADYSWRTREFAKSLAETKQAVLRAGRPTLLAWFGDHQPPFMAATGLASRLRPREPVPPGFVSWYEIESNLEHEKVSSSSGVLDIAFLPGLIAERAGLPLDRWLAANVLARHLCGGLFDECADVHERYVYLSYLLRDLQSIH